MKFKILRSGNILKYQILKRGSRGGVQAEFTSHPIKSDGVEAKEFLASLIPSGATVRHLINTDDDVSSFVEDFLEGGKS